MRKICLGFTLIELLVAVSVMGIVFSVGVAKYQEFNRRQIILQAAEELKSDLRLAQDKALAGEKPADCVGVLEGYRLSFTSEKNYKIEAVCSSGPPSEVKSVNLPGNVTGSSDAWVTFKVLAQGVENPGDFYLSDNDSIEKVAVEEAGNIYREVAEVIPTPTTAMTPTPTPPVGGENLVENPGFEEGTTRWSFYCSGSGYWDSVSPGYEGSRAGRISISAGGGNIQLYQTDVGLEPNTDYRLSFAAYSNRGHDLEVYLHKHSSPYTNYGLDGWMANLGTSWQTFSVDFTSNSSASSDARLRFWLASHATSGDVYWIDQIVLVEI